MRQSGCGPLGPIHDPRGVRPPAYTPAGRALRGPLSQQVECNGDVCITLARLAMLLGPHDAARASMAGGDMTKKGAYPMSEQSQPRTLVTTLRDALQKLESALELTRDGVDEIDAQAARLRRT